MRWPFVNPIMLRVMNSSGRQLRHVWVRMGYLIIILSTLMLIMVAELSTMRNVAGLAQLGESLFKAVSYAQLTLILFLAPIYTAGAISQERDAETFSVLLATPLSNVQIVFGSLMSRLFFVLAILFSTLPIFALLYYFGGFELRDVILSYGIAASSALLTGAVAIAISILRTGTRRVMISFFIFIILYLVGIWLLDHGVLPRIVPGYVEGSLRWLHPLGALQSVLSGRQVVRPDLAQESFAGFFVDYPEYGYLIFSLGLSAVIVGLAAVLVRRLARGYGGLGARVGQVAKAAGGAVLALGVCYLLIRYQGLAGGAMSLLFLGLIAGLAVFFIRRKRHARARTVWDNPIAWRERVTRTATTRRTVVQFLYIMFSILAVYAVLIMKMAGFAAEEARIFVLVVTCSQALVLLMVGATMAASCISYEKEQGTLEILLATPITAQYYVYGKFWGIVRYLGLFLAMMVVVTLGAFLIDRLPLELYFKSLVPPTWLAGLKVSAGSTTGGPGLAWGAWPWAAILHPALATAGMAMALVTVGMDFSLKSKSGAMAGIYSALMVLGVSAATSFCCFWTGYIPVVGWMACFVSPFLSLWSCLMPDSFATAYNLTSDGDMVRINQYFAIHVGALGVTVAYAFFARNRLSRMTKTFDQQTRRKA